MLSCIVAMSENRVIGTNNSLPWHLPEDLKYFKRITLGHPIIMGRKTYESIGRPLPGRANIVVTRQPGWSADGVLTVGGIDAAIHLAEQQEGGSEVFVIGGAELFRHTLGQVERLYLTQVHAKVAGDVYFPDFNQDEWREVDRIDHQADQRNPYSYSFLVLNRMVSNAF